MTEKNEGEVVEGEEETLDLPAEPGEGEEDLTDWKVEAQKLRDKAISQRERTKTLKKELAETKKAVEVAVGSQKPPAPVKTGELDETQLDYLDLKGISDPDEIDIIQKVIAKTGQTVRQTLKDEYVVAKLDALKKDKEVKNATPSATKRGGGQTDDLAQALAKFEQTGELPADFALRSAVVNAKADKENTNKPSWL